MDNIFSKVAKELSLRENQVESTVKLLDEGATVPFISRYRKEITGNLDEVQITDILEKVQYLRNLEKRKEEVLRLIEEQGKLTEELTKAIQVAEKLQEVEDIYFPYRKKKKTKADVAIEKGLEPLADFFLLAHSVQEIETKAQEFITEEVPNIEEAIEGAKLIWAQKVSEKAEYRERIREILLKYGKMDSKESKKAKELDEKAVYQDYYEYSESLAKIPSHRILAVNRGEKEGILSVNLSLEEKEKQHVESLLLRSFTKEVELYELFHSIIRDAYDRLLFPAVEREVRNILTDKAEEEAILVFRENLKNLLLQAPLHEKTILALDPGYRTGFWISMVFIKKTMYSS